MEEPILIVAFYKFVPLPDYREMRGRLLLACHAVGLRGTILLAREGVNAMIAGTRAAVETVMAYLRADPRLADLMVKESFHNCIPFGRMKVRLKREIVAMKVPGVDPSKQVGAYVEPKDWNRLIAQDDLLLLDARNDYEARMGSFPRSLNPETGAFHELPRFLDDNLDPQRHKRVAMFCTGGIRCEKATAYLLAQGFPEVFHLRGGILNYLAAIEPAESLWQGECFVFDERVSLDQRLQKGRIVICDDCKAVVNMNDAECPRCGSDSLL